MKLSFSQGLKISEFVLPKLKAVENIGQQQEPQELTIRIVESKKDIGASLSYHNTN